MGAKVTAGRGRGHHAGLTREAVLRTAVELVDEQGLAALSMRRLGAELGVKAMALYHHVGSKQELLDGLVELLFAEVVPTVRDDEPWQASMRRFAHTMLDVLLAHPNLVPVVLSRPATTPEVLRILEESLGALRQAGFRPDRSLDLIYALIGFVVGHVATGGDAGDGTAERLRLLAALDLTNYPLLAEAARGGAQSTFDITLEAILGWFEHLPRARTTSPRSPGPPESSRT